MLRAVICHRLFFAWFHGFHLFAGSDHIDILESVANLEILIFLYDVCIILLIFVRDYFGRCWQRLWVNIKHGRVVKLLLEDLQLFAIGRVKFETIRHLFRHFFHFLIH